MHTEFGFSARDGGLHSHKRGWLRHGRNQPDATTGNKEKKNKLMITEKKWTTHK